MFIVLRGGVCAQDGMNMSMEPKITFSKIFIFQPILEFQNYTEAKAVKLCTF
jgi:hypothetical protein